MEKIDFLETEFEDLKKQFYFLLKSVTDLSAQVTSLTNTLNDLLAEKN